MQAEAKQKLEVQDDDQQVQKTEQTGQSNIFCHFKRTMTRKCQKLSRDQLLEKLIEAQINNKKLKNRLVSMQPFKQKHLKIPNQQKNQKLFDDYETRKFALKICYLGHLYDGMAIQFQTQNTIQQYLFKCMHILNLIPSPTPSNQQYTRAGRTDKGVSAMGNVVCLYLRTKIPKRQNFPPQDESEDHKYQQIPYADMLNSILPQDIRILSVDKVHKQFNARYQCISRAYKYFFTQSTLDIELMRQAMHDFKGRHNFINFCKMNLCNTVNFEREIKDVDLIKVENTQGIEPGDSRNEMYYFRFVGNSFLWHQIRYMVSVLFMIGQGTEPPNVIKDLLSVQKYPKKPNYSMASEYPLILEDCEYQNLTFKPNQNTIFRFYNTFNQMVSRKTIEQNLVLNCMFLARRDLMKNVDISHKDFTQSVISAHRHSHKTHKKSMQLHKPSGRGMQMAIQSLKGKRKALYEKKAKKQAQFEAKQKIQKEEKSHQEKVQNQQDE